MVFLHLISLVLLLSLVFLLTVAISRRRRQRRVVGFFHPTKDGGGGERVLWCAVRAVQDERPDLDCVIFTGDRLNFLNRAHDRFGIKLIHWPEVVHLSRRKWIEERTYPCFTMIGQSLGSVYLCLEALYKCNPQVYVDTSGYAFTYPLARLFGCKVICYTHYPTISSDMVSRVRNRNSMYNNDGWIANSIWLSQAKVIYYTLFSWLYGVVGSYAQLAMVNSSWTRSHIEKLWRIPTRTIRVYPPCDTTALKLLPLKRATEIPTIISVAQFRPEKAHTLQLEAFALALQRLEPELCRPKLQFVGSCRNREDEERLQRLIDKCYELNLNKDVEFYRDVEYKELVQLLGGAIAGLHSMTDEHFGISIVEYMSAGAIPIAHNSAGPKLDIIVDENGHRTGFLAHDKEEYADAILQVLKMPEHERLAISGAARIRAMKFSDFKFYEDFNAAIRPILSGTLASTQGESDTS